MQLLWAHHQDSMTLPCNLQRTSESRENLLHSMQGQRKYEQRCKLAVLCGDCLIMLTPRHSIMSSPAEVHSSQERLATHVADKQKWKEHTRHSHVRSHTLHGLARRPAAESRGLRYKSCAASVMARHLATSLPWAQQHNNDVCLRIVRSASLRTAALSGNASPPACATPPAAASSM